MKSIAMGLGMVAGAALTLTVINSLYPDVPKRMMRDGRRACRNARRTVTDFGDMMGM